MQKHEQSNEKGKNFGFYAASGICLLTLAAAIGVGAAGLGREDSTQTAAASVAEDTQAVDAEVPELAVEEEPAGVTIGGYGETEEAALPEEEAAEEPAPAPEVTETLAPEEALPTATEAETEAPSFLLPVEGEVLQEFSNGELVKNETLGEWRTHDGVDLAAPANTPVKAAADGTVSAVTEDPLWGMCVTVSHDGGYQTFYQGLKTRVEVSEGDTVKVGEILGYVGTTAEAELSLDPHLHFAVQKDGAWVDPASVLASEE